MCLAYLGCARILESRQILRIPANTQKLCNGLGEMERVGGYLCFDGTLIAVYFLAESLKLVKAIGLQRG